MPATHRLALSSGLLLLLTAGTGAAQSWPASALALLTNGSSYRQGESIRLSLLALEEVGGPFVPQVRYGFEGSVTVNDRQGLPHTIPVKRAIERPAGASLERLEAGPSAVLDDTFCFGKGSTAGPYEITVSLASGNVKTGTLTDKTVLKNPAQGVAWPHAATGSTVTFNPSSSNPPDVQAFFIPRCDHSHHGVLF